MSAARIVITSLIYNPVTAEPYKVIQKYDDITDPMTSTLKRFITSFFYLEFSHLDKIIRLREKKRTGKDVTR